MYTEKDLVRIARRENNTKRNYLVVNELQGKHIPVSPTKALNLFKDLASVVKDKFAGSKVLVIGFAETATAIGAQVAIELGAYYIQTTREIIPGEDYLFFSEEHSHATEQKIVKGDFEKISGDIDHILFVEDEVTTGKTILNIISLIRKNYSSTFKFSVLSVLNGMSEENLNLYAGEEIDIHYLVKTNHSEYSTVADKYVCDGDYKKPDISSASFKEFKIDNYLNARRLVNSSEYRNACESLWEKVHEIIREYQGGNVLVVGTEEMMFPALYVASKLENEGKKVKSHSTTRSPIEVSLDSNYPLHVRYELKSLYDSERKTFLYNIEKYDYVLVITDAVLEDATGTNSLINALKSENDDVTVFRWC